MTWIAYKINVVYLIKRIYLLTWNDTGKWIILWIYTKWRRRIVSEVMFVGVFLAVFVGNYPGVVLKMMHHPNMHHQAMSGHPPQHLGGHQGIPPHHQMPPHQLHRENRHVPMPRYSKFHTYIVSIFCGCLIALNNIFI